MTWVEMLLFCLIFHVVDYCFKILANMRNEIAISRMLRDLSIKNQVLEQDIRRVK